MQQVVAASSRLRQHVVGRYLAACRLAPFCRRCPASVANRRARRVVRRPGVRARSARLDQLKTIEVLMVHAVEVLRSVNVHEVELLVPHILTELVPLHLAQPYDDLVVKRVQLHAVLGFVQHQLAGAFADGRWYLVVDLRRYPHAEGAAGAADVPPIHQHFAEQHFQEAITERYNEKWQRFSDIKFRSRRQGIPRASTTVTAGRHLRPTGPSDCGQILYVDLLQIVLALAWETRYPENAYVCQLVFC